MRELVDRIARRPRSCAAAAGPSARSPTSGSRGRPAPPSTGAVGEVPGESVRLIARSGVGVRVAIRAHMSSTPGQSSRPGRAAASRPWSASAVATARRCRRRRPASGRAGSRGCRRRRWRRRPSRARPRRGGRRSSSPRPTAWRARRARPSRSRGRRSRAGDGVTQPEPCDLRAQCGLLGTGAGQRQPRLGLGRGAARRTRRPGRAGASRAQAGPATGCAAPGPRRSRCGAASRTTSTPLGIT